MLHRNKEATYKHKHKHIRIQSTPKNVNLSIEFLLIFYFHIREVCNLIDDMSVQKRIGFMNSVFFQRISSEKLTDPLLIERNDLSFRLYVWILEAIFHAIWLLVAIICSFEVSSINQTLNITYTHNSRQTFSFICFRTKNSCHMKERRTHSWKIPNRMICVHKIGDSTWHFHTNYDGHYSMASNDLEHHSFVLEQFERRYYRW